MSMFVERAAVTTYVDTVVERKDAILSNYTLISVVPAVHPIEGVTCIRLTVGAYYRNGLANTFSKEALAELIKELQAVHDAMN